MISANVKHHEKFSGIYWTNFSDGSKKLATQNLSPGINIYGEKLIEYDYKEYRVWDPYRSKLAAAILNGLQIFPFKEGSIILYLGVASGTTASHISDIIGSAGRLYCIDFAERAMRDLINNVCSYRENIFPVLADARRPDSYRMVTGKVEYIYCDVAQPEQAKILADNADVYLKPHGKTFLVIKARSIDVTKIPSEIFKREMSILESRGLRKIDSIGLEPYDKAHSLIASEYI